LLNQLAAAGPFTFYKNQESGETYLLQLSLSFLNEALKELLPLLTAEGRLGREFTYGQIRSSLHLIDPSIFDVIARYFSLEASPALAPPSITFDEMEVERRYRITLPSLLKFFMTELLLSRSQYSEQ
jgi:hypothetical protein